MARREQALRKTLMRKGDALSELAAKEAHKKEQRLAAAQEEIDQRRKRIELSEAREERARTEARDLRAAVQQSDEHMTRCDFEREEIKRQVRLLAEIDVRLHEDLKYAQQKLWQKEQKEAQKGSRPWQVWAEVGSQP